MAMQNYEMWIDLVGDGDAMKVTGSKEQTDAMEALISCTHHFDGVTEMWVPLPGHEDLTPGQRDWWRQARERFNDVMAKEYQADPDPKNTWVMKQRSEGASSMMARHLKKQGFNVVEAGQGKTFQLKARQQGMTDALRKELEARGVTFEE